MELSQIKILYYPKYTSNIQNWVAMPITIQSYLSANTTENIGKRIDGCNLPLVVKQLYKGSGTYSRGDRTFTVPGANWRVNQFTWHTLVDKHQNRFVIEKNSKNTVTIANPAYFKLVSSPVSGDIEIHTPDFKNDDIVEIYGWKTQDNDYSEPDKFSDKIIFVGQVSARKIKKDNRGQTINLKLTNLLELLLKTTREWTISTTNFPTAPDKIKYIADQVSNMNKGVLNIVWHPDNPTSTTLGSQFPAFQFFKDDSSAYDAITDLSSMQYTGDVVDYYMYLRPTAPKTYALYWRPKTKILNQDLVEGVDFDFLEFDNDKAEIISGLVVVCGRDCNNSSIRQSVSGDFKDGSKTKRIASDITSQIYMFEHFNNSGAFDIDSEDSKYPTTLPYTTATYVTADEVNAAKGTESSKFINTTGNYTLNTKKQYNEFIRHLSRVRATIYGKLFLLRNNKSFDKLKVRFYNTPALQVPGETSRFIIPSIGWVGDGLQSHDSRKIMRLTTKQISIDEKGIVTTCEYSEDPDKLKLPLE